MNRLIKAILIFSAILIILQIFQDKLVFHRDLIEAGQWWRIVSGNFTHSNYPHLFLNLAGLWIFSFLFMDSFKLRTFILSTLFLSVIVGAGLYFFNPELHKYYGFSGVLYGLFICGASSLILQKDYFTSVSIILFIVAKVIWDLIHGGSSSSADLIGIPVAVDAHLYGILGAAIISLLFAIKHRLKAFI